MSRPNWTLVKQAPAAPAPPAGDTQKATRARNAAAARRRRIESGEGLPVGQNPCTAEIDYTAAEVEFATALDRYKREKKRPFPTNREILKVLLGLGYRKEATPCDSTPLTSL
jgi:hypothetical protein